MLTITFSQQALLWIFGGGFVGAIIGFYKNRVAYGFLVGAVLGPVGWVVAALSAGRFRECPACAGRIPEQAKFCPKCGVSIAKAGQRTARSALKGEMR